MIDMFLLNVIFDFLKALLSRTQIVFGKIYLPFTKNLSL